MKEKELKVGDRLKIYNDPITEKDPEGDVTLLKELNPTNQDGISWWLVRFDGDPEYETYIRKVKAIRDD